jgi:uncharacterized protein (DUF433 family)
METTVHSINLIVSNPKKRAGRPCIAGTGVRVMDVAIAKIYHQQDEDTIADSYDLTLPQVYAALSYYYNHKAEIDTGLREEIRKAREYKEQRVGSRHPPLSR